MASETFDKRLTCDNCGRSHTFRFHYGTVLRGKNVLCPTCGVKIPAAPPAMIVTASPRRDPLELTLAFARDFFNVGHG